MTTMAIASAAALGAVVYWVVQEPTAMPSKVRSSKVAWSGPLRSLSGRVVRPSGDGIPGATIQIVSPDLLCGPAAMVVATTTSAADGSFRLEPRSADSMDHLVVTALGERFAFPIGARRSPSTAVSVGDLHVAPTNELRVAVECGRPLSTDVAGPRPVVVAIRWLGHPIIPRRVLLTRGTDDATQRLELPLYPGFDATRVTPPSSARHFERTLRVPSGALRLTFSGGCGHTQREVELPADGSLDEVSFTL